MWKDKGEENTLRANWAIHVFTGEKETLASDKPAFSRIWPPTPKQHVSCCSDFFPFYS